MSEFTDLLRRETDWDQSADTAEGYLSDAMERLRKLGAIGGHEAKSELLSRFENSGNSELNEALADTLLEAFARGKPKIPSHLYHAAPLEAPSLVSLIQSLAWVDPNAPLPADDEDELAPFLPSEPEADIAEAERYLHRVQHIFHDVGDRDAAEEQLDGLVALPETLAAMQIVAAGLALVDVRGDSLSRLRIRIPNGDELGVPERPFAEVPQLQGLIGSPSGDDDARGNERPQQEVEAGPHRMLATPLTLAQYLILAREGLPQDDVDLTHPATLNWDTAKELFTVWSRRLPDLNVRMPTEAEWELSARAGTQTKWWTGDDPQTLPVIAHFDAEAPAPVIGTRAPNELGLFDVHGLIWEWCADEYVPYGAPPQTEGDGRRVARGGSWSDGAVDIRAARREAFAPDVDSGLIGCRALIAPASAPVPLTPPQPKPGTPTPTAPAPQGGGGGKEDEDEDEKEGDKNKAPDPDAVPGQDETPDGLVAPPGRPITGSRPAQEDAIAVAGGDAMGAPSHGDDCCCVCCDGISAIRPSGDAPSGQLTPAEVKVIDDVEAAAKKVLDAEKEKQAEKLKEGAKKAKKIAEDAAAEKESQQTKREKKRVAEERERIKKWKEQTEREETRLNQDKKNIAKAEERIDELKGREAQARANGDGAMADQIKATREALETRVSQAQAQIPDREQRVADMKGAVHQREARLEAALDRGYGLTPDQHRSRRADNKLERARRNNARVDSALDLLNEREAAQGGLTAEDRRLKRSLEQRSERLDREINGRDFSDKATAYNTARSGAEASANALVAAEAALKAAEERLGRDASAENRTLRDAAKTAAETARATNSQSQTARNEAMAELNQARRDFYDDSLRGRAESARIEAAFGRNSEESRSWRKGSTGANARARQTAERLMERAERRHAMTSMSADQLDQIHTQASRAAEAIEAMAGAIGQKDIPTPNEFVRWQAQAEQANGRLADVQGQIRGAGERLRALGPERRKMQKDLARARNELGHLGANEFSQPSGPNADRISELQDQIRQARPQLRGIQGDINGALDSMRQAQGRLAGAREGALMASGASLAVRSHDRLAAFRQRVAPWVDEQGNLQPGPVRDAAGRALRAYQRFSNFGNRLDAIAALGNNAGPEAAAERAHATQQRAEAQSALEDMGWEFGPEGIDLPDDIMGKAFAGAFTSSAVQAREEAAKSAWDTVFTTPKETVKRLKSEAEARDMATRTLMAVLGIPYMPAPTPEPVEDDDDKATRDAKEDGERKKRLISNFVRQHIDPVFQDAVRGALEKLLDGLSSATVEALLRDATSALSDFQRDPATVLGVVQSIFREGARQLNGVDGVARVALAGVEAFKDLMDAVARAENSSTQLAALQSARQGYLGALEDAKRALDDQASAARARGQTMRARTIDAWGQSLAQAIAQANMNADANEVRTSVGEIGDNLEIEIELAKAQYYDLRQKPEPGLTSEYKANQARLKSLRNRVAMLTNARIRFLSSVSQTTTREIATSPKGSAWFSVHADTSRALADAISNEAERLSDPNLRTEEESETAETEIKRLTLLEAFHLAEAGEFALALQHLNIRVPDGELTRLKVHVAIHAEARMEASSDTVTDDASDKKDWMATRDAFLAIVETLAATRETKGTAAAKRGSLYVELGQRKKGIETMERGAGLSPNDHSIRATIVGTIIGFTHAKDKNGEKTQVPLSDEMLEALFRNLNHIPASQVQAMDTKAALLLAVAHAEDLAGLRSKVAASDLADHRKAAWQIRLGALDLYNRAEEQTTVSAALIAEGAVLNAMIDATRMSAKEKSHYRKLLTEGLANIITFTNHKSRFLADKSRVETKHLDDLARSAAARGEFQLAVNATLEWLKRDRLDGLGTHEQLQMVVELMASINAALGRPDIPQASPDQIREWKAQLSAASSTLYYEARRGHMDGLVRYGRLRADDTSSEAERYWFQNLWREISEKPYNYNLTVRLLHIAYAMKTGEPVFGLSKDGLTPEEAARAKTTSGHRRGERFALDRLSELTDVFVQIQLATSTDATRALDEGEAEAQSQLTTAQNLFDPWRNRAGSISSADREHYFEALADLRAAESHRDAWRTRRLSSHLVPTGAPNLEPGDSAALAEIARFNDQLYGNGRPGSTGLYGQLIALQTRKTQTEGTRRQIAELNMRINDTEARMHSWIKRGPIPNPKSGKRAKWVYRTALLANTTRTAIERAERARDQARDPVAKTQWNAIIEGLKKQATDNPYLSSFADLLDVAFERPDGQPTYSDYAPILISSLNTMLKALHREANGYYYPTSVWDINLVSMAELWVADPLSEMLGKVSDNDAWLQGMTVNRDRSHSYKSTMYRMGELRKKANSLVAALEAGLRSKSTSRRLEPGSTEYKTLKDNGFLAETDSGYALVISSELDADMTLENLREKYKLPKTTGMNQVTSIRTFTEIGATMLIAGVLGVGITAAAVRIAGLVSRVSYAGRGMMMIAESPMAMRSLGVVREAAAMTMAGRSAQAFMHGIGGAQPGALPPRTTVVEEFGQNLVTFAALSALGPILRMQRANPALQQSMRDLQSFMKTGKAGPVLGSVSGTGGLFALGSKSQLAWHWLASGIASTGLESLVSGQPISAESFLRNLITIPGMQHIIGRFGGMVYPRAAPVRGARGINVIAPLKAVPNLPPRRLRAAQAKFDPVMQGILRLGDLDGPLGTARLEIEGILAGAGIILDIQTGQGPASFARLSSGQSRIQVFDNTSRRTLIEELAKAQVAEALRLSPHRPFTVEIEALLERDGLKALVDQVYTDPNSRDPAYVRARLDARSRSENWARRLAAIRSGAEPNFIIRQPGEGLIVFNTPEGQSKEAQLKAGDLFGMVPPHVMEQLRTEAGGPLADAFARAVGFSLNLRDTFARRKSTLDQIVEIESRYPDRRHPSDVRERLAELEATLSQIKTELSEGARALESVINAPLPAPQRAPLGEPLNLERLRETYGSELIDRIDQLRDPASLATDDAKTTFLEWVNSVGLIKDGTPNLHSRADDLNPANRATRDRLLDLMKSHPDVRGMMRGWLESALLLPDNRLADAGIDASAILLINVANALRLTGDQHAHLVASVLPEFFSSNVKNDFAATFVAAVHSGDYSTLNDALVSTHGDRLIGLLGKGDLLDTLANLASFRAEDLAVIDQSIVIEGTKGNWAKSLAGRAAFLHHAIQFRANVRDMGTDASRPLLEVLSRAQLAAALTGLTRGMMIARPADVVLTAPDATARSAAHDNFFRAYSALHDLIGKIDPIKGANSHDMLGNRPSQILYGYRDLRVAAKLSRNFKKFIDDFTRNIKAGIGRFLTHSTNRNRATTNLAATRLKREARARLMGRDGAPVGLAAHLEAAREQIASGTKADHLILQLPTKWLRDWAKAKNATGLFGDLSFETVLSTINLLRERSAAQFGQPPRTAIDLLLQGFEGLRASTFDGYNTLGLVRDVMVDTTFQRMIGLDISGKEAAGQGPASMVAPYMLRSVENAKALSDFLQSMPEPRAKSIIAKAAARIAARSGANAAEISARLEKFLDPGLSGRLDQAWREFHQSFLKTMADYESGLGNVKYNNPVEALRAAFFAEDGQRLKLADDLNLVDFAELNRALVDAARIVGETTPHQLGATIHAGEQLLSNRDAFLLLRDVESAIAMGTDRISHGVILGIDPSVLVQLGQLDASLVGDFVNMRNVVLNDIAARGVTIELNITSNLVISNLTLLQHPAASLIRRGDLRFTVNTDDAFILATSGPRELALFASMNNVDLSLVVRTMLNAYDTRLGGHKLANAETLKEGWQKVFDTAVPPGERRDALIQELHQAYIGTFPVGGLSNWQQRALDAVLNKVFGASP